MSISITIVNHSKQRVVSSVFLKQWIRQVFKELKKRNIIKHPHNGRLTVAFVTEPEIKRLNQAFRNQKKATDILSFHSNDSGEFGELALCPPYIHQKWVKSSFPLRECMAYLILHGILHILGFEHEKNKAKAKEMYHLQDSIFFTLQSSFLKK